MTIGKLGTVAFVCFLVVTSLALRPLPARAEVASATIVVVVEESIITSTFVQTMAIVTQSRLKSRRSQIECHFVTAKGGGHLYILSKDQRRIEALYQQIVTAAAGGHAFQITAKAHPTQNADYYEANLESDQVYLILH